LFALSYYGNGGWTWQIAYSLPVHIRRYCLKLIREAKERENSEAEKHKSQTKSSSGKPNIPSAVNTALGKSKSTGRRQAKK